MGHNRIQNIERFLWHRRTRELTDLGDGGLLLRLNSPGALQRDAAPQIEEWPPDADAPIDLEQLLAVDRAIDEIAAASVVKRGDETKNPPRALFGSCCDFI
jgi:hypothetical protein